MFPIGRDRTVDIEFINNNTGGKNERRVATFDSRFVHDDGVSVGWDSTKEKKVFIRRKNSSDASFWTETLRNEHARSYRMLHRK